MKIEIFPVKRNVKKPKTYMNVIIQYMTCGLATVNTAKRTGRL